MLLPRSQFVVTVITTLCLAIVVTSIPIDVPPPQLSGTAAAAATNNNNSISSTPPKIMPPTPAMGPVAGEPPPAAGATSTQQQPPSVFQQKNASSIPIGNNLSTTIFPSSSSIETNKRPNNQKVTDILKSMATQMPTYASTLLNGTLYPFIEHCDDSTINSRVCIGYIEMISTVYNNNEGGGSGTHILAENITHVLAERNRLEPFQKVYDFCKVFSELIPVSTASTSSASQPGHQSFRDTMKNLDTCFLLCNQMNDVTMEVSVKLECQLIAAGYTAAKVENSKGSPPTNGIGTISSAASAAIKKTQSTSATTKSSNKSTTNDGVGIMEDANKLPENMDNDNANKANAADSDEMNAADADAFKQEDDTDDAYAEMGGAIKDASDVAAVNKEPSSQVETKKQEDQDFGMQIVSNDERGDEIVPPPPLPPHRHDRLKPKSDRRPDDDEDNIDDDDDSYFFEYFLFSMFLVIVFYVSYHNRGKLMGLILEGRRGSVGGGSGGSRGRGGGIGRRKHTAAYRKLDTNLEEAISSSAASRTSQIIY